MRLVYTIHNMHLLGAFHWNLGVFFLIVLQTDRALTIVVVGGGAGGVELALSLEYRLGKLHESLGQAPESRARIM